MAASTEFDACLLLLYGGFRRLIWHTIKREMCPSRRNVSMTPTLVNLYLIALSHME